MKKQEFKIYSYDRTNKKYKEHIHTGYIMDDEIAIEILSYGYFVIYNYKKGYKITTIKISHKNKLDTPLRIYKHYINNLKEKNEKEEKEKKEISKECKLKHQLIKIAKNNKNLNDVKKTLNNLSIEFVEYEGILNNELQINKNNCKWYRIIQKPRTLEFKEMKRETIGGPEASLKANLIQEQLSFK